MNVVVRNSYEQPSGNGLTEVAVFCDVFRASTTLLTILSRSPKKVFLTNKEEVAAQHVANGAVLFSEVWSGGFDNSPYQAASADLSGKVVVHKSTNLTNAIFHHPGFRRGFVGGFVNLTVQSQFLLANRSSDIELVAASHFARGTEAVEDVSCVRLLAMLANGARAKGILLESDIRAKIESKRQSGTYTLHYFNDVEMALKIDLFDFLAEIKILSDDEMELISADPGGNPRVV